jgi:FtsH-binding integral membrane protein
MQNYTNYFGTASQVTVNNTIKRVYLNMTLGLLVTAFVSMFCAGSYGYLSFILSNSWAMWGLVIAQFGVVIGLSAGINKLSGAAATALFYVYAVLTGMTFSTLFLVYTATSIAKTFFITAAVFGAMSIYGYFTNKDLTRVGSFLVMALIGLVIVSLINMFVRSSQLDWIVSFVGVLIFIGLTAWDTQKIKMMAMQMPESSAGRLAAIGALSLYLDFINIFLYLLRFFGNNRD